MHGHVSIESYDDFGIKPFQETPKIGGYSMFKATTNVDHSPLDDGIPRLTMTGNGSWIRTAMSFFMEKPPSFMPLLGGSLHFVFLLRKPGESTGPFNRSSHL